MTDHDVWKHKDGTPHSSTGPLGCLPCANARRQAMTVDPIVTLGANVYPYNVTPSELGALRYLHGVLSAFPRLFDVEIVPLNAPRNTVDLRGAVLRHIEDALKAPTTLTIEAEDELVYGGTHSGRMRIQGPPQQLPASDRPACTCGASASSHQPHSDHCAISKWSIRRDFAPPGPNGERP